MGFWFIGTKSYTALRVQAVFIFGSRMVQDFIVSFKTHAAIAVEGLNQKISFGSENGSELNLAKGVMM